LSQFHFTASRYLQSMRDAVPRYDEFQQAIADSTVGVRAARVLDLGAGTGETARHVLALHPSARVTLVDKIIEMLQLALSALPPAQIEAHVVTDIEEPLPPGPFELVVSAFAIHHLSAPDKADLFCRVSEALAPRGRFVMGDVVIPDDVANAVTPIAPDHDRPERTRDLLESLSAAGLSPRVTWCWRDLVVIVGQRAGEPAEGV
jgi:tRNA (cmo5U34)-methyltransferase